MGGGVGGAIIFRTLVMAIQNYTLLRYPIIGLNLPEPVIIAIMPLVALFNATEPLYVILLGYFIAKTVGKNLKDRSPPDLFAKTVKT